MRTAVVRTRTLVLGLALAALCPALYAQTGAASITGIVSDATGAAAPGVTVTAVNQATNVEYSGTSNTAGNYTITALPVGT
jgi:Carboxypeptidase regulatory-like domain